MLPPRRLWALCFAVAMVTTACSSDGTPVTSDRSSTTITTTTTTAAVTTTTTSAPPDPPPTVIVAGDSIIYDVAPALVEALDPDQARVIPLVAPALSAESNRVSLLTTAREAEADVVFIMVGIWERTYVSPEGATLGQPGWSEAYSTVVLDPVAEAIAAGGGRLVLLGPPHIQVVADDLQIAELERVWADYAASHPSVSFIDSDSWLLDADRFVAIDGAERIRRLDGIHLCAEGARRIAAGVLEDLSAELDAAETGPRPDWETGAWTARFPVDECPPVA